MRYILWEIELAPPTMTICVARDDLHHQLVTIPIMGPAHTREEAIASAKLQLAETSEEYLEVLVAAKGRPVPGRA
jgi:hypothetical protein